MKRQATLLLMTMAAAILLASGVALAKTFTCLAGSTEQNPCKGTKKADIITGTDGSDFILGKKGADRIDGRGGSDTIDGGPTGDAILSGGSGADTVKDGSGAGDDKLQDDTTRSNNDLDDNDTLEATAPKTLRNFSTNTGADFLISAGGNDTLKDLGPGIVFTTSALAIDTLLMDIGPSDGVGTDDTYVLKRGFGHDQIADVLGSNDVIDLRDYSSSEAQILGGDNDGDGLANDLVVRLSGGSLVVVSNFFDDTSSNLCSSGLGPGNVEKFRFSNGDLTLPAAACPAAANFGASTSDGASLKAVNKVEDTAAATHGGASSTLYDRKEPAAS